MMKETEPNTSHRRAYFVIASILLAALLLFIFLPRNTGPFRALPAQSALVLECGGLFRAKLLTDKTADAAWREVLHTSLFEQCFADVDAASKLLGHHPQVLRAFAKNKALAAFSLHPADSLHALFAVELDQGLDLEKVLSAKAPAIKFFPHQFHGNTIFNVHLSKTEQLEVACAGRLLLFSRKATLIEDALAQLENAHNWWSDRPYIRALPEAALRIQLRPGALAEQWRNQMDARWRGLPDLLARNIEWAGLSWDGETLQAMVESNGFLSKLPAWGKEADDGLFEVLPDNTAFLLRAGLGNVPEFFKQIGDVRSSDFEQFVLPWAGAEVALVVTEPLSPALGADRLLLLSVCDSAEALRSLRRFAKERGALPGASGAYQMFEVFGFQNASLLKPLLGDDESFRNPVCAMVGHYVVFAPDRSSLEIVLDKYLVNQTLSANTDFLQLQQKLAAQYPASCLLNTAYLPGLLLNTMGREGEAAFARPGFVAAALQPGYGRKTSVHFASKALSQPLSETAILWKTVLQAPIGTKPFLISQTAEKQVVLAQDIKQKLYCLDAQKGGLMWSKSLSERIVSDIVGIDYYGNGSKCYTFNTPTQIYTLDENGRDVEGFPFKLPAVATNGATVVDFDNNFHFNYFVAAVNGKIYGFGPGGKPLDGWNGAPLEGAVKQPILHFQHKGKDYLAVLSEQGQLSVFGRDGALRFEPVYWGDNKVAAGAPRFYQPMAVDIATNTPHIYSADAEGHVFSCDLQGKATSMQIAKPGSRIAFGQLAGDARFEWAAADGKHLSVGNGQGATLFSVSFAHKPQQLFFAPNQHIGALDRLGRRIWLFDSSGKIASGFPLGGNTVCQFGRLNGVDMLITGNGNAVWAYRMRWQQPN